VEQLVHDSIEHARADFSARRFIELKNKADADIRHTEKAIAAAGPSLNEEQRKRIGAALVWSRQAMQGDSVDRLQEAVDELGAATLPLAQLLMNAVVQKTLKDKTMDAIKPEQL
jgi:hypothetical protein